MVSDPLCVVKKIQSKLLIGHIQLLIQLNRRCIQL